MAAFSWSGTLRVTPGLVICSPGWFSPSDWASRWHAAGYSPEFPRTGNHGGGVQSLGRTASFGHGQSRWLPTWPRAGSSPLWSWLDTRNSTMSPSSPGPATRSLAPDWTPCALALLAGAVITPMIWKQLSMDSYGLRLIPAVTAGFLLAGAASTTRPSGRCRPWQGCTPGPHRTATWTGPERRLGGAWQHPRRRPGDAAAPAAGPASYPRRVCQVTAPQAPTCRLIPYRGSVVKGFA